MSKLLRKFRYELGLGAAYDDLMEKSLKRGVTITDLRNTLESFGDRLLVNIKKAASEAGVSQIRLLRNLIADSERESVWILCSLVEFWSENDCLSVPIALRQFLRKRTRAAPGARVLRWLMVGGNPPGFDAVVTTFGAKLPALLAFEREVLRSSQGASAALTARLLAVVAPHERHEADRETRQILAVDGFAKGLQPLDQANFVRLSKPLRAWILNDKSFRRIATCGELRDMLEREPEEVADTPEQLAIVRWQDSTLPAAIDAIRQRDFTSSPLSELLRRQDLADHADTILAALRKRRESRSWGWRSKPEALNLPPAAVALLPRRAALALGFFAKPPATRLSICRQLEDEEIRLLAGDVSPHDWQGALRSCKSLKDLKRVRDAVCGDPVLLNLSLKVLSARETTSFCLQVFVPECIEQGDPEMLRKLFRSRPDAFAWCRAAHLRQDQFRSLVEGYTDQPASFLPFVKHAPASFLGAIFTSRQPWAVAWCRRLTTRATTSRDKTFRSQVRKLLLYHAPDLIPETLGWQISGPDFKQLVPVLAGDPPHPHRARLCDFTDSGGRPWWERMVCQGEIGQQIRRLIHASRPDLLERLDRLHVEGLLETGEFRSNLRRVLAGKQPPSALKIPQRLLRHCIPWVRKTWQRKPTLAVAYELALAVSPADACYLAFLCMERWQSPAREAGGTVFDHHYETYSLPKKSGGKRLVSIPEPRLKRLQQRILQNALDPLFIHPCAHGFRRGRSTLTNALPHVGHPCVVNVDIRAFFPSTSHPLILRACSFVIDGGLSEGARHVLADICSFQGALPTGAPTSPALANLVLRSADSAITTVAKRNGITYTRYADDLTFSGGSNVLKILPFVTKVLSQLGYELDAKKTNIFRRGRRQIVTGLVVNEKPNLPRRIRRRLRAAAHHASQGQAPHWHGKPMSLNRLIGHLAHLNLVQPVEARTLLQQIRGGDASPPTTMQS